jgi:hypothetical protein
VQELRITPEGQMRAPSVTSTMGAARARQVLRLPGIAGITVAGQRRNLTGLPLDIERVDSVVIGTSHGQMTMSKPVAVVSG